MAERNSLKILERVFLSPHDLSVKGKLVRNYREESITHRPDTSPEDLSCLITLDAIDKRIDANAFLITRHSLTSVNGRYSTRTDYIPLKIK